MSVLILCSLYMCISCHCWGLGLLIARPMVACAFFLMYLHLSLNNFTCSFRVWLHPSQMLWRKKSPSYHGLPVQRRWLLPLPKSVLSQLKSALRWILLSCYKSLCLPIHPVLYHAVFSPYPTVIIRCTFYIAPVINPHSPPLSFPNSLQYWHHCLLLLPLC